MRAGGRHRSDRRKPMAPDRAGLVAGSVVATLILGIGVGVRHDSWLATGAGALLVGAAVAVLGP